jgi:hypothetical protein
VISGNQGDEALGDVALATVVSFVVGLTVIAWMLRYLATTPSASSSAAACCSAPAVLTLVAARAIS